MSEWPKSDVCSACRFYTYNDDECGDCQRYPPSVECDGDVYFPVVGRLTWCGEFKPLVDKVFTAYADAFNQGVIPAAKIGDAYPGSEGATL